MYELSCRSGEVISTTIYTRYYPYGEQDNADVFVSSTFNGTRIPRVFVPCSAKELCYRLGMLSYEMRSKGRAQEEIDMETDKIVAYFHELSARFINDAIIKHSLQRKDQESGGMLIKLRL